MQKIHRSALVGYSAEQMYNLVNDVEQYPKFVPNCKHAAVITRDEFSLSATLEIAKSGVAKSLSTSNTMTPFQHIHIELLNGPFKHFQGDWRFTPLNDSACKIELDLEFEFSNKLASIAFASVFNQLAQSMVGAFTQRATQVYG